MAFRDLREFISLLEKEGELQRIEQEVDWNLEVGAIIRRGYDLKAPAPLFEKIKDYPQGYRILGGVVGASDRPQGYFARVALSLGMKPDSAEEEIIEEYITRKRDRIRPVTVSSGPCKENVHLGNEIDLLQFPAPFLHTGDGGRYIGTWHVTVNKDLDSNWINWGMYRLMVHSRDRMGGLINPIHHIGLLFLQRYEPRKIPMEFAIAIGTDPIVSIAAIAGAPKGVNEADIAGGLRKAPVELVKAETVDLEVPSTAEIVIEGVIMPGERKEEGPFAEYTGYSAGGKAPRPVYTVKAITHRNNPILTTMGVSAPNGRIVTQVIKAAEILEDLREMGLPVKMVHSPQFAVNHMTVVSTKVPYANYPTFLANAIWGSKAGASTPFLVIVEDDIDVTSMDEVIWAITTRCHPDKGIFKVPQATGHQLLPFLSPEERRYQKGAQVLFNCTWPKDWPAEAIPVKSSFDTLWPKDIQEKVLKNWKDYGF